MCLHLLMVFLFVECVCVSFFVATFFSVSTYNFSWFLHCFFLHVTHIFFPTLSIISVFRHLVGIPFLCKALALFRHFFSTSWGFFFSYNKVWVLYALISIFHVEKPPIIIHMKNEWNHKKYIQYFYTKYQGQNGQKTEDFIQEFFGTHTRSLDFVCVCMQLYHTQK